MFANGYRKFYHYHLKKCGGTTLNDWLANQVSQRRAWSVPDVSAAFRRGGMAHGLPTVESRDRALISALHWSDGLFTHTPMAGYLTAETFCFTVLRDPVRRLLSHVSDMRRDAPHYRRDSILLDSPAKRSIAEADRLSLKELLIKNSRNENRYLFDNYMTRSLASLTAKTMYWGESESRNALEPALEYLNSRYQFVGLTERLDESVAPSHWRWEPFRNGTPATD
ncbi:MAG: hypothetical protein QM811_04530 [Pirellulales bacterium]